MPVESEDSSLFNQDEISAILKRAAEMQGAGDPDTQVGFSLDELQNIAADAGIDPKYVTAAASEVARTSSDETGRSAKSLFHTENLVVDGGIGEAAWEAIVAETRQTFKDTGKVHRRGNSYEWTHSGKSGEQAHVMVTEIDGRTHIRTYWQGQIMKIAVYTPTIVLAAIMLPLIFESTIGFNPAGIAVYVAIVGSLFFLANWMLGRMAASQKTKVSDLMTRIEEILDSRADIRGQRAEVEGRGEKDGGMRGLLRGQARSSA